MARLRRYWFASLVAFSMIAPAMPVTIRRLQEGLRQAKMLRRLSPDERRRAVLGPPFVIASELRARLPQNAAVDFVMMTPQSRELAQFTGAYLSPRPCRYFDGENAWRQRTRAIWIRDARGANAPPGPPPGAAAAVVIVDTRLDPPIQIKR